MLIPCAGKGKRLNVNYPKILFKINNQTLLDIIIKKFTTITNQFCFVISEDSYDLIKKELSNYDIIYKIVIQKKPTGMSDAIKICKNSIETTYTIIIWGDQIGIKKKTIKNMVELSNRYKMVIATKRVINPYIHFQRNQKNEVTDVLQKREGDSMPRIGETDAGIFIFKTSPLFKLLEKIKNDKLRGKITRENNFLPFIILFINKYKNYFFYNGIKKLETIGINYKNDSKFFQKK